MQSSVSYIFYGSLHKVRIYKEYHSVCPLFGIETLPTPLLPASVPLRPEPAGQTRLRVRAWGSPNPDDWRKSLALCLLYWVAPSFGGGGSGGVGRVGEGEGRR